MDVLVVLREFGLPVGLLLVAVWALVTEKVVSGASSRSRLAERDATIREQADELRRLRRFNERSVAVNETLVRGAKERGQSDGDAHPLGP